MGNAKILIVIPGTYILSFISGTGDWMVRLPKQRQASSELLSLDLMSSRPEWNANLAINMFSYLPRRSVSVLTTSTMSAKAGASPRKSRVTCKFAVAAAFSAASGRLRYYKLRPSVQGSLQLTMLPSWLARRANRERTST